MSRKPPPPPRHEHDVRARLLALAVEVFGTERAATMWMTWANPEFDGLTPDALVRTGRAVVVEDFLQGTLEGDFG